MRRRKFLQNAGILSSAPLIPLSLFGAEQKAPEDKIPTRLLWLNFLEKLATPVLTALAADRLRERMPVEANRHELIKDRAKYTHLEAFGRLLCGIAPWLSKESNNDTEKRLQQKYFYLALKCIGNATNPAAKDYMNWGDEGGQPLVDASFFAYALIRCPALWDKLDTVVRKQVISCLIKTRKIKPPESNWLLFAAMIEMFFMHISEPFEISRITYAINQHRAWYKGDGMYGDGAEFHWDYYNSFVIQPYLYDILNILTTKDTSFKPAFQEVLKHNLRYAAIQERLIAADGTYPAIGRSITYRTGAFHHLANMALTNRYPLGLNPAQVRCALTAVIDKTLKSGDIFDANGWLQIGLYGHQPQLAEDYISTGSLYLCSTILLPLGLPENDPFWNSPDELWTAKKLLAGINLSADHASS